jgi:hypothetical protein
LPRLAITRIVRIVKNKFVLCLLTTIRAVPPIVPARIVLFVFHFPLTISTILDFHVWLSVPIVNTLLGMTTAAITLKGSTAIHTAKAVVIASH